MEFPPGPPNLNRIAKEKSIQFYILSSYRITIFSAYAVYVAIIDRAAGIVKIVIMRPTISTYAVDVL